MSEQDVILATYHQAVARHTEKTGVSYPLTRANCVEDDGTITDTNVHDPVVVAKWKRDAKGRVRIKLIEA